MSSKEELYRLLLDASPCGTLYFVYGVCIDCNPCALRILDCDRRAVIGTTLDDTELSDPLALVSLKQTINNALEDNLGEVDWLLAIGDKTEHIYLHVKKVGDAGKELIVTLMPVPASAYLIQDSGGASAISESTVIAADAENPGQNVEPEHQHCADRASVLDKLLGAEQDRPPSELDRELYYDSLTQLPNRQMLIEIIRRRLGDGDRVPACTALMLVDLDHFKDINDSWGHNVGDQVLFKVARALETVADEDIAVARMSGDEFMVFLPDAGSDPQEAATAAAAMAGRIKEIVAKPIFYDGNEFILTASVGIALLTDSETAPERALQYADTAMYEAKRKGRNGIAFFDQSISDKAQRQIGLNTRLRKAVDNQEFALYIQPQVSTEDGSLVGGEALLRWVNADRVTNMPSEFIPLLESSGLIVDVGHWVIRTACEYLRGFIDEGIWKEHMLFGINISPRQFNDAELIEVIEHSLHSYEIDPKYLNFEITENLVIEDVEDVVEKMSAIKALGARFSIDDFGIGYSSMIYLKRLPFDWLKIDREFIRNIHNDAESRGVVEAILAVSRQYGLHVTAEGVENEQSLDILRRAGCDSYQGAHFSMPVPVDQFREFLAA
ncbi:MAG TPA: hypothetical protein DCZ13_07075 [Porticoccaceae bacterium]|nr:hypothetical protein [Porticoccaceae bacterium]